MRLTVLLVYFILLFNNDFHYLISKRERQMLPIQQLSFFILNIHLFFRYFLKTLLFLTIFVIFILTITKYVILCNYEKRPSQRQ